MAYVDVCGAVVAAIRDEGFDGVYVQPPAMSECREPVVVAFAGQERVADAGGIRREVAHVGVTVVREDFCSGQETMQAIAAALRHVVWEGYEERAGVGLVAFRVSDPEYSGRNLAGRFVWHLTLDFTLDWKA